MFYLVFTVLLLLNNISFTLRGAIRFTKFVAEIHARKNVSNFSHIVSKFLILNILRLLNSHSLL